MNTFKQRCIELRKQDLTLPQIMAKTGRSKTSVYFHIRNISLSKRKLAAISRANKVQILRISADRKGKSKRSFKFFSFWDKEKVLLVAGTLGAASIFRTTGLNAMAFFSKSCLKTQSYCGNQNNSWQWFCQYINMVLNFLATDMFKSDFLQQLRL